MRLRELASMIQEALFSLDGSSSQVNRRQIVYSVKCIKADCYRTQNQFQNVIRLIMFRAPIIWIIFNAPCRFGFHLITVDYPFKWTPAVDNVVKIAWRNIFHCDEVVVNENRVVVLCES